MIYCEVFEVSDDMFIVLSKGNSEPREHFLTRANFIIRNFNRDNLLTLINKSYLYLNVFILNKGYSEEITNSLNKYDCVVI